MVRNNKYEIYSHDSIRWLRKTLIFNSSPIENKIKIVEPEKSRKKPTLNNKREKYNEKCNIWIDYFIFTFN